MPKSILGIFILLFFNLIGELTSRYLITFLPGSVVGMLLFFVALQLGWVKEKWVVGTVTVFMRNLPILFIVPSVGVITVFDLIKNDILNIALAIMASTVCVIAAVGVSLNLFTRNDKSN